ncbi:uncharacterized protein LOC117654175 [Thrips palmi]|uniref:Uncharacterized protein LOC117654175 n=1 Tax=Thrips palmi TaxID=161013 RepID=A0A6P9AFP8_THRPL|nr:uncharacterized protein LOC117654175 [Thrips palmi]
MTSARAKALVASCKNNPEVRLLPSPVCARTSPNTECSPVSSWWDDVFDASDIQKHHLPHRFCHPTAVKRKLSFSPDKAVQPAGEEVDDIHKPPQITTAAVGINNSMSTPKFAHILCNSVNSKKPRYPSQQPSYEAKLALNAGKEHMNSSGKIRRARCPQPACKLKCKRCSSPRLTEEERLLISKQFWNLQNHEQQWLFIFKSIKLTAPKRKTSMKGAKGEKLVNREYSFCIDKEQKKVCKTMFKTTLSICDSWIVNALSHCCDDLVKIPDNRGKHKHQLAAHQGP